jgi:hypothetical protein
MSQASKPGECFLVALFDARPVSVPAVAHDMLSGHEHIADDALWCGEQMGVEPLIA